MQEELSFPGGDTARSPWAYAQLQGHCRGEGEKQLADVKDLGVGMSSGILGRPEGGGSPDWRRGIMLENRTAGVRQTRLSRQKPSGRPVEQLGEAKQKDGGGCGSGRVAAETLVVLLQGAAPFTPVLCHGC